MTRKPLKPLFLWSLSLISFSLCNLAADAAPVGMAAELKGNVQVESGGKKAPLKLLGRVESGDVVYCGAGAQAIIVLFSGGARYQIGANQSATVGATKSCWGFRNERVERRLGCCGAETWQRTRGGRYGASEAQDFRASARRNFPAGLPLDKPKFEWLPLGGAATYTFTLFDQYDNVVWRCRTDKLTADLSRRCACFARAKTLFMAIEWFWQ